MLIVFQWEFLKQVLPQSGVGLSWLLLLTQTVFDFYMSDPQDWIALASFEATFLVVGGLAGRLKT